MFVESVSPTLTTYPNTKAGSSMCHSGVSRVWIIEVWRVEEGLLKKASHKTAIVQK